VPTVSVVVGADPDALDATAEGFARSADALGSIHGDVTRLVRQSPWSGRDAMQFDTVWSERSRPAFDHAVELLRRASQALRRNAEDQRRASAAEGGWAGGGSPTTPTRAPTPEQRREELAEMAERTEAEQLAWWGSLTDAERADLLEQSPNALLALTGLPEDVRAAANAAAADSLTPTIATVSEALSVEAGVNVKLVSIGAEGEAVVTEFADGHVEVSVGGELAVGVGPRGTEELRAEVRLTGSAVSTWELDDQEQADRFLRGLLEAPLPDDTGDWFQGVGAAILPGAGASGYLADEITEYLRGQTDAYKTTVVGAELSGDVAIGFPGVGDVEVHDGIGVTYDTAEGTTTAYIETSASGSATLAPWAGAAAAETKLAVTWGEDGSIESMTITGEYSAQSGAGFDGPVELSSVAGTSGAYEVELDLSDSANQSLALDLLQGAVTGDVHRTGTAFAGLVDSSQVILQTNVVSTTSFGVDAVVANAGGSGEVTTNVDTFVKPGHGDFLRVTR
jgi:hypothetical protein